MIHCDTLPLPTLFHFHHSLKLTWRVSRSKLSFNKARKKFKQTVVKRKMHRQSMGVFEQNSRTMGKLYKTKKAVDDSSLERNSQSQSSKPSPWAQKRGSKGTEQLHMELNLPMSVPEEEEEQKDS